MPLAVVDEDFHLMGVISRVALLDSMSRSQDKVSEGSVMSLEDTGKLPVIKDVGDPVGLPPADQTTTATVASAPITEKESGSQL